MMEDEEEQAQSNSQLFCMFKGFRIILSHFYLATHHL